MDKARIFSKSQLTSHNLQDLCVDFFILKSKGILHIGAYDGKQFAQHYSDLCKPVIWIEANDRIFPELLKNISTFTNQTAHNLLLGSSNRISNFYEFNNLGSSSIFPIRNSNPWDLKMTQSRQSLMTTLSTFFTLEDLLSFDFWVIDTQGAELEILKGTGKLLECCCTYLYVEVSNDNFYLGGAEYSEMKNFLSAQGFVPAWEFSGFHGDVLFINSEKLKK